MAKKNKGGAIFLEGAVAGLVLGVAATVLMESKKGKAFQQQVKEKAVDFYKYIAPKVKTIKKMSEKEYKEFMKVAVVQYAKAKKISEAVTKELVKETQKSWSYFSKHLGK